VARRTSFDTLAKDYADTVLAEFNEKERATRVRHLDWWSKRFAGLTLAVAHVRRWTTEPRERISRGELSVLAHGTRMWGTRSALQSESAIGALWVVRQWPRGNHSIAPVAVADTVQASTREHDHGLNCVETAVPAC
jgi:hypothetical protein